MKQKASNILNRSLENDRTSRDVDPKRCVQESHLNLPGFSEPQTERQLLGKAIEPELKLRKIIKCGTFIGSCSAAALIIADLLGATEELSFGIGIVTAAALSYFLALRDRAQVARRLYKILRASGRCGQCGYFLRVSQTPRCPECGHINSVLDRN